MAIIYIYIQNYKLIQVMSLGYFWQMLISSTNSVIPVGYFLLFSVSSNFAAFILRLCSFYSSRVFVLWLATSYLSLLDFLNV